MTRKALLSPTDTYRVIRMQGQASLDRQNFGPKRNFSISVWRFLDGGKFNLAIIIFPGKIMQKRFGTTYLMFVELLKIL